MFNFADLDFTLYKFRQLLEALAENYSTLTMAEYLCLEQLPERFALIRHDVDRMPKNSLNTSLIESELGVKATYYFRARNNVFVPEILQEIAAYGHEIGYHYEVLSDSGGDYDLALALFKQNLKEFRNICEVKTICMHGSPLSKYDNRDLWKKHSFETFGIIGEAYLSVEGKLNYFSDTGRSWNSKNNIRDFLPGSSGLVGIKDTDELIELIREKKLPNFYILIHPERWASTLTEWSLYYSWDLGVNLAKKVLLGVRK
ncbi:MAG: hypothetical protein PHD41_03365 [Methanosarcinaceae archaeon]|nr:hypothetical protein [Methanosarcinaceae archaeon]MDD4748483.1 hypothetical protein [Methanosarcinaceae archaeon]